MPRLTLVIVLAALVGAPVAAAHDPLGRAEPSIGATLVNTATRQVLLLTIVDLDSRKPIPALRLTATARRTGQTAVPLRVVKLTQTRWRIPLASLRRGKWHVSVRVRGTLVAPRDFGIDFARR